MIPAFCRCANAILDYSFRVNSSRISFARTLPIVALLLSFLITAIPATRIQLTAPHGHALRLSIATAASHTSHAVQALNLPAFFADLAAGLLAGSWHGWSPASFDRLTWRAIAFPLYCLPFWWLIGMALDALLAGTQLRRSTLFVGCVLWAVLFSSVWVLAFTADQRTGILSSCLGFALWFSLSSVFPGLWIKERLAFRRLRTLVTQRLLSDA